MQAFHLAGRISFLAPCLNLGPAWDLTCEGSVLALFLGKGTDFDLDQV